MSLETGPAPCTCVFQGLDGPVYISTLMDRVVCIGSTRFHAGRGMAIAYRYDSASSLPFIMESRALPETGYTARVHWCAHNAGRVIAIGRFVSESEVEYRLEHIVVCRPDDFQNVGRWLEEREREARVGSMMTTNKDEGRRYSRTPGRRSRVRGEAEVRVKQEDMS